MIEFIRDPETGYVYAYEDGVLRGPICDFPGNPPKEPSCDLYKLKHQEEKQ